VRPLLPQIKAPTVVVHVKGDKAIRFDSGREIAGGIRGASLVSIEGDRHAPDEASLAQINEAIRSFFAGDDAAAAPTAGPAQPHDASVTVMFTDVEGSTALTDRLGDESARAVLRTHERVTREALAAHGGSEIKTMGDGFMASFSSATRALQCAIAIQQAFAAHNASGAGDPIRVRIGLNAGEPITENGDLFGTAVNMAARVAAKANGGEILASNVVRELTAGKEFLFSDRGDSALRGFEEAVRLYEVRWEP
jgi:class 3 adenylate cyclase